MRRVRGRRKKPSTKAEVGGCRRNTTPTRQRVDQRRGAPAGAGSQILRGALWARLQRRAPPRRRNRGALQRCGQCLCLHLRESAEFVVKDKEARGKVGTGTHQYVLPAIGKEN